MEQKSRYLIMIFLVVLIMDYLLGQMNVIPEILGMSNTSYQSMLFFDLLSFVLIFIAFYLIGKKFDVRTNLKLVIITLLIGTYVANLLVVPQFLYLEYAFSWEWVFYIFFPLQFFCPFFVAFSALSIAYFRNNNGP